MKRAITILGALSLVIVLAAPALAWNGRHGERRPGYHRDDSRYSDYQREVRRYERRYGRLQSELESARYELRRLRRDPYAPRWQVREQRERVARLRDRLRSMEESFNRRMARLYPDYHYHGRRPVHGPDWRHRGDWRPGLGIRVVIPFIN